MTTGSTTEFPFELPRGYVDAEGVVHRTGTMRRATGRDELAPLIDRRVRDNPEYLGIVVIGQVITRLGPLTEVDKEIIEKLFPEDLAYLQKMYIRINDRTVARG